MTSGVIAMHTKIVSVKSCDDYADEIIIELGNRNVIILTLKSKLHEPLFAEIVKERFQPKTDGVRIKWQNGSSLTLEEITEMLRSS